MGESLETRRWSLSIIVLEFEGIFCNRLVDPERRGEFVLLIESRDELLNDRSALVRTLGVLDSAGSGCSIKGS